MSTELQKMESQRNWAAGAAALCAVGLFADNARQTIKSWVGMEETIHVTVNDTTADTTTETTV